MATLSEVATALAAEMERSGLADTIKLEIPKVIRHLNKKPFSFQEVLDGQITTVSGTEYYSAVDFSSASGVLPNFAGMASTAVIDLQDIRHIRVDQSGSKWELDLVPYAEFERLKEGVQTTSVPSCCTRFAGQIGLWPTPGAAYSVYVSATVNPPIPTADGDDSIWFDRALELVEAYAGERIARKKMKDYTLAAAYRSAIREIEGRLSLETARQSGTGRIQYQE